MVAPRVAVARRSCPAGRRPTCRRRRGRSRGGRARSRPAPPRCRPWRRAGSPAPAPRRRGRCARPTATSSRRRLPRLPAAPAADVEPELALARGEAALQRAEDAGGDARGVPVHPHHRAEGLEPEGMGEAAEELVARRSRGRSPRRSPPRAAPCARRATPARGRRGAAGRPSRLAVPCLLLREPKGNSLAPAGAGRQSPCRAPASSGGRQARWSRVPGGGIDLDARARRRVGAEVVAGRLDLLDPARRRP